MVFISIIFAILIPQEVQDAKLKESFKDSMAAVALLQQMDGEWKLERCNEGRLKKYDGLVTVTKNQLVFILRRPDSGGAPLGIEPAKGSMYYAFGKEKK